MRNAHSITLSDALVHFSENLHDIKEALAQNMTYEIQNLPVYPTHKDPLHQHLREQLRTLNVQKITERRLSIIRRIDQALRYKNPRPNSRITPEQVQRAKERPIAELYDGKLIKGKLGLCPFHTEKSPSFNINLARNTWRCFGCNTFGDAIDFVMKRDNITFTEAVKQLL